MSAQTWRASRACCLILCALAGVSVHAQNKETPGVSASEIKIGQTMPYSGAASLYGTIGRAQSAYFDKVNAEGGINGRKIKLLSLDDAYTPPKTVEHTRRLVEQEQVLLMFGSIGTGPQGSVHKYLNARKVPQLFLVSIGLKWNDPRNFPWTMSFLPSQKPETAAYVQWLSAHKPDARIAVLYQNDDFGKDYLRSLRAALGDKADKMILAEKSYELTDPTIDSQIVSLGQSGADTFFQFASAKFAAMTIRKAHDIGWKPLQFVTPPATSIDSVLKPAGLDKSAGLMAIAYLKDPSDAQWASDKAMQDYFAWMKRYYPQGDPNDFYNALGYSSAQLMVHVLQNCGGDLTRENVMRQAANIKNLALPLLLPGIKINTSATDFAPLGQVQLMRFDGKRWSKLAE
jgi:branched-chain amino acid transport system substrate-binding protein